MIRPRHAAALAAALMLTACQPRAEVSSAPEASADTAAAQSPAVASPASTLSASTSAARSPAPQTPRPETRAPEARAPEARIPEGPDMTPQRVPLDDRPCREALGEAASARLVQRCIAVSPTTHPPCNAANPCDLIQGEIDRACALWTRDGETPPKECRN